MLLEKVQRIGLILAGKKRFTYKTCINYAVTDIAMFALVVYPQDIQIRIADTFYYPYRIAADIWISDYIHIRGYADLDISRMLPQSTLAHPHSSQVAG